MNSLVDCVVKMVFGKDGTDETDNIDCNQSMDDTLPNIEQFAVESKQSKVAEVVEQEEEEEDVDSFGVGTKRPREETHDNQEPNTKLQITTVDDDHEYEDVNHESQRHTSPIPTPNSKPSPTQTIDYDTLINQTNESLLKANKGIKRRILFADPPWKYGSEGSSLRGLASNHYNTMSLSQLKEINVKQLAAKHCFLFMWTTSPQMEISLELMKAWGFKFKTFFGVWVKTTNGEMKKNRLGYYTKQCAEFIIMGTRGQPLRYKKTSKIDSEERVQAYANVFFADSQKHSKKPSHPREVIDTMFHNVPKLELFARERTTDDWDVWGNEIEEKEESEDTTTGNVSETEQQQQQKRIAEIRITQTKTAEQLDAAKSIGSFGGMKYETDHIDDVLNEDMEGLDECDGSVAYSGYINTPKYSVLKERKNYFTHRIEKMDSNGPSRYNLRRGTSEVTHQFTQTVPETVEKYIQKTE